MAEWGTRHARHLPLGKDKNEKHGASDQTCVLELEIEKNESAIYISMSSRQSLCLEWFLPLLYMCNCLLTN